VLGQFDGYRDVPGVAPGSTMDTFVAARLWIDNSRWRGVPFYLRTGKRLAASGQRVSIISREPAGPLAGKLPCNANVLAFSLDGSGQIDLTLLAKKPGPGLETEEAHASIPLSSLSGADPLPPYVRLIHDVIIGDRSLFTRRTAWPRCGRWPTRCCRTGRRWPPTGRVPGDRPRPGS